MTRSLNDSDMITSRRAVIKTFAARAGLAAAVVATGVALASSPAAASDKRNQTANDTGRNSDDVAQTDHD